MRISSWWKGKGRSEVEVPGCLLQGEKGKKRDPEGARPITGRDWGAAIGTTRVSLRLRELIEKVVGNRVNSMLRSAEVCGWAGSGMVYVHGGVCTVGLMSRIGNMQL